jgi:uncharacterized protein (TIGR00369 family)
MAGDSTDPKPPLRQPWVGSDFQDPPRTDGGVALCGACRKVGRCHLGVEREHLGDDGIVRFNLTCPPEHEGGPNVAHGGWTAAALDDCLGHVPMQHGTRSVTAELTVSYVKPVPVGRPLEITAQLDKQDGSRWYISAELVLLPGRAVLARAHGIWVARDARHFDRHEQWLAEQA